MGHLYSRKNIDQTQDFRLKTQDFRLKTGRALPLSLFYLMSRVLCLVSCVLCLLIPGFLAFWLSPCDAAGMECGSLLPLSSAGVLPASPGSADFQPAGVQNRPAIVDRVNPVYLPKTTILEFSSDRQVKIKQIKLSQSGILLIEVFNAKTSLPDSISIDKGILRSVAFETQENELKIYISLTEPVVYEVESGDTGLKVSLQNPILEQLVSIDVNDEHLSTVLLMLFTQYEANIVAGSRVSGKVTAHLVDVPLKAALDEILKAEGYGYVEEDGLIRVVTAQDLAAMRESEERGSGGAGEQGSEEVEMESKLFELRHANSADIQQILLKIIGTEGSVISDPRTNSVIVISSRKNIDRVEELIKQLDIKVADPRVRGDEVEPLEESPEELISMQEEMAAAQVVKRIFRLDYMDPDDAKTILEPLLSDQGTIASVMGQRDRKSGQGSTGGGGTTGTAGLGVQLEEAIGQGGYIVVSDKKAVVDQIEKEIAELDVPVPQVDIEAYIVEGMLSENTELGVDWIAVNKDEEVSLSFSGDGGGVLAKGIIPVEKFTGILNALSSSSDVRVLSNPSITTLQSQPAMFHSGDKIPYSKIFIQDGIEQVDTVFEEVGIVLAVTPYVKEDDMVSLLLSTSVSSEGGFTPAGQPRISTRTTRSQVLVKSGDTVAIAGLISDKTSVAVSKVPLIGDIPLIGRAFSTESEVKQKSEVTIFITPRIVD